MLELLFPTLSTNGPRRGILQSEGVRALEPAQRGGREGAETKRTGAARVERAVLQGEGVAQGQRAAVDGRGSVVGIGAAQGQRAVALLGQTAIGAGAASNE